MITWFVVWVILAVVAGIVASNKNRSAIGWAALSFFLTPLLLLILLVLPSLQPMEPHKTGSLTKRRSASAPASMVGGGDTRTCPFCAEEIKTEATLCKHCGKESQKEFIMKKCSRCGIGVLAEDTKCDNGHSLDYA